MKMKIKMMKKKKKDEGGVEGRFEYGFFFVVFGQRDEFS